MTRADELAGRLHEEGSEGEILHQQKLFGLVLDATLALLDKTPAARTAIQFAALLPPDTVPWPWLRALVTARHPELAQFAPDEPDPWYEVRRRMEGLRLLTSGDQPEIARIHRLVAAHLSSRTEQRAIEDEAIKYVAGRARFLWNAWADPINRWEISALAACAWHWIDHKDGIGH